MTHTSATKYIVTIKVLAYLFLVFSFHSVRHPSQYLLYQLEAKLVTT